MPGPISATGPIPRPMSKPSTGGNLPKLPNVDLRNKYSMRDLTEHELRSVSGEKLQGRLTQTGTNLRIKGRGGKGGRASASVLKRDEKIIRTELRRRDEAKRLGGDA